MDDLKRSALEELTMTNKDCPCNGCLPPKRSSDCHSVCPEYPKWSKKHVEELTAIREQKKKNKI